MCEVIVGIDFGSSGTGYAFSYKNPKEIEMGVFPEQGTEGKVPTEIILSSKFDILAFGEECSQYIISGQLKYGDLYFRRIKMNLYNNQFNIKPENNPQSYPLVQIITKVLEYVKKVAISKIHENRDYITEEKIKWVVTVPAIWNEKQKGIMIEACEKAKLFNQNTNRSNFFALEPEAASLYCSQNEGIDQDCIMPGKTYIICDLGGGTGDIVTHNKNKENIINEKYQAIGGDYGSDEIDKEIFNKLIEKIFGFKDYNSLKKKNEELGFPWKEDELYCEWFNLAKEIQNKKKITLKTKDKEFTLNCQIFKDFTEIKFKDLVDKYNNNCKNKDWNVSMKNESRWILSCKNKIFFDLIKNQASKISLDISKIYQNVEEVESILYVGGYCSNEIVTDCIKKEFRFIKHHLKPSFPDRAVVKGAVLFGINPLIIKSRKAKYSIGISTNSKYKEEIHGKLGVEKYIDEEGVERCRNCFKLFIKIGEIISIDDIRKHNFTMVGSRYIGLKFYKTSKPNPILCSEENVDLFGEDTFDLKNNYPKGERSFTVEMKFGGTFVVARCIHTKSGKSIEVPLYFK